MRRTVLTLFAATIVFTTAVVAQAQTPCPGPVATITSPAPGSTLPVGAVTFTWCSASADYFLTIESPAGAANIYNAFVVGQESVTLGPACNVPTATNPTTQCIPTNGAAIFVTLWTNTAASGRKNFVAAPTLIFTAANSNPVSAPVATTTTIAPAAAVVGSRTDQSVTLSASIAATSAVNQGNVTFRVIDGAADLGAAVTSATVAGGNASVTFLLPGGTAPGIYTIQAGYSGGVDFLPSSGTESLVVESPPPVAAPTTITVAAQSAAFNGAAQDVTVTATVAAASAVNEGTVTFRVVDGASALVGTAVTSATLSNGSASAIYSLPAGLAAASYTILADYSDGAGSNFQASSGSGPLTINPPAPGIQSSTATTVHDNAVSFSASIQSVTLTAVVAVAGGSVNEGTVTFQVQDAANNPVGVAVPSASVANGSASVSYVLPAGLAAGGYKIAAAYSGGAAFLASSGAGTLVVGKAASSTHFASAAPAVLAFNATYTPTVSSTSDGALTIGASGSCSAAGGVVTITSGAGACTVTATAAEGQNFLGSAATPQVIAAAKAPSTTSFTSAAPVGLALGGTYTPAATSTGDGTVAIATTGACSFAGGVVTITAAAGTCAVGATVSEGANFLGSSAAPQVIVVVAPPTATAIDALVKQLGNLNLRPRIAARLMAELRAARNLMNAGNRRQASSRLREFIEKTAELLREGKLSAAQAGPLIAQARTIVSQLMPR